MRIFAGVARAVRWKGVMGNASLTHPTGLVARFGRLAGLGRVGVGGLTPTLRVFVILVPSGVAMAQPMVPAPWASLDDPARKAAASRPGYDLRVPARQAGLEDIVVFDRHPPAQVETPGSLEPAPSLRSMFNVRGEAMVRPENCQAGYTTVAGQPAVGADFAGPVGISGCYW